MQAASDNLGELPPGFAVSQGPGQPVARQGPDQDAPDFPHGYYVGQLEQASSAGMCQKPVGEHTCVMQTAGT